jgi:glycine hydroxymethyltransferase
MDKLLENFDNDIFKLMQQELKRQQEHIELIASENFVSKAVLQAQGSILTNKYAEGYPHKRYYGGCEFVDGIEELAISRVKQLFNVKYANVQPHSGSQANMAVYMALLNFGDTVLGMDLNCGGHLTHGAKVSFSGKFFNAIGYKVNLATFEINYNEVRELALKHKPKMIIAGGSSYSKQINFKIFKEIAIEVGAYLMVDMAHFAGLVAGGVYNSPVEYADVITSTTHKTLRGPRGGIILTNNEDLSKKINSAIFPGSQGGPLMHIIAAKAVAFKEALQPEYKIYVNNIVDNAKAMCNQFINNGIDVISGITESHLLVINVGKKGLNGNLVEKVLDTVNITCNKNSIPFDALPPSQTSGIRLGTPAITTRGFLAQDSIAVANLITEVLNNINKETGLLDTSIAKKIKEQSLVLCKKYPLY